MKLFRKMLLTMLTLAMVLSITYIPVCAGSNAGNTEDTAIKLVNGKKKTAKFRADAESPVYFVIGLEQAGRLSVSVSAAKLGTGATILIRQNVLSSWKQTKNISYNKSKKVTSGTLKSEYILQKGNYIIEVIPGKKLASSKKFTITAKATPFVTDDVEPDNNKEETAQSMNIYKNKTYNMYLSNGILVDTDDTIDCFKFAAKSDESLKVTMSSKVKADGVKLLLRQKTDDGYTTVQSFDVKDGKLSETLKVKKGTYYWKVWYSDANLNYQMPYTIKCAAQ